MTGESPAKESQLIDKKDINHESTPSVECAEMELMLECGALELEDMGLDIPILFCA